MGYRSNGGIVIYGPEDVMTAFLAQERLRSDNTVAHNDDSVKIYKRGDDLVWHLEYEYWKWYEDYPDIAAFERVATGAVAACASPASASKLAPTATAILDFTNVCI